MTLGKRVNFSGPQFPPMDNEANNTTYNVVNTAIIRGFCLDLTGALEAFAVTSSHKGEQIQKVKYITCTKCRVHHDHYAHE